MIEKIFIQHYKSIKELFINLGAINILIGANGVGKSNFISYFKLLNILYKNELKEYIATHGKANSFLHFGVKVSQSIHGGIAFKVLDKSYITYTFNLIPNQSGHLIINEEKADFGFSEDMPKESKTLEYESYFLKTDQSQEAGFLRNYFQSFQIYHFHDTTKEAALRTSCPLKDNRVLKGDGSNLAAFLYFLQERHSKNFKFITRTIQSIAPFFKGFSLEPDNLNPDMIELVWEEKGSDMYLNAQNLSDGTIRFIALATLLLQPNPPRTIIIDEPELGLHPFAINKLAGLIKKASAKSQIILSTQSVNLVSNFEPESVITVDRADGQSVFKRLDSQDLENWLEDYSLGDLWTKNIIGGQP
jgi:predicted ATPase